MKTAYEHLSTLMACRLAKMTDEARVLNQLAYSENSDISICVAKNEKCPPYVLKRLLSDRDISVRLAAAEAILDERLLPLAITVSQDTETCPSVLRVLLSHPIQFIVFFSASNPSLEAHALAEISYSMRDDIGIMIAVAENPTTDLATLTKLAESDEPEILKGLMNNESIPKHLVQYMYDSRDDIADTTKLRAWSLLKRGETPRMQDERIWELVRSEK